MFARAVVDYVGVLEWAVFWTRGPLLSVNAADYGLGLGLRIVADCPRGTD